MATKKTSRFDFSFDNIPQGDEYLLMDHRLPEPAASDAGKPVVATGADTYGLGKRTVIHVCTATANSSANAMMLDIAKSEVMEGDCLLVTFSSLLGTRMMFNGGIIGNPMYSVLYRGALPSGERCLNAGDTWMVRFADNTFNLLFRDREHFEDAMLGDGAFYPNAVQDFDGNWYDAVIIGNQVWLAENLRTTHYSDGTAIAYGNANASDSTPYYYHAKGQSANDEEYGLLYNWPAVMNGASASNANPSAVQGIAPTGWHVPSSGEWEQLKGYMEKQPKFLSDGKSSTYIAKALASVGLWGDSSTDYSVGKNPAMNNRSGFNSKPAGGMQYSDPYVSYDGENSAFFSTTSQYITGSQTIWSLHHYREDIYKFGRKNSFAHSVRCVCDMTPYQFREWYVRTYGTLQHHVVQETVNTCGFVASLISGSTTQFTLTKLDADKTINERDTFLVYFGTDVPPNATITFPEKGIYNCEMRYLNTRNNTKYIKAGAFVLMRWFPNYFFHIISISGEREIGTTLTASNGDTSMNMPLPSANPNLTVLVDNHSNSSSLVFSPTNDALTSSGITKIYSSDINYAIVPAGTRMMFELKVYYDGTDKILYIKNNKCTLMWESS